MNVDLPPAVVPGKCARADELPVNYRCGMVQLDRNPVGGDKIALAAARVIYTAEPYRGVLLINPGGLGRSNTIFPYLKDAVPDGGDSYDWIGFVQ